MSECKYCPLIARGDENFPGTDLLRLREINADPSFQAVVMLKLASDPDYSFHKIYEATYCCEYSKYEAIRKYLFPKGETDE